MSLFPFVLSYPRSGMNWLRHCVETMSGLKTPGPDHGLVGTKEFAFCRLHYIKLDAEAQKVTPRNTHWNGLCLMLRNYRENYVRTPRWTFTSLREGKFRSFANNIIFFEHYAGPKLVIRYEDHIQGFEEAMRFMTWAGIPYTPLDPSQYEAESERSKQWYRQDKRKYYRRTPNREITDQVRRDSKQALLKTLGPRLFEKYFSVYNAPGEPLKRAA